jgi:gliding motility-associated protein GldM
MALPKEPRQKMINLMYLVLTALLALNVSSEILNAFKTVNNSLQRSSSVVEDKNQELFRSFRAKLNDPTTKENAAIWYPKAMAAQQLSDAVYSYIESLKLELKKQAGYDPPKDTTFKEDNLEAATRMFVEGKEQKGAELLNKLTEFKQQLLADPIIAAEFSKSLPLDLSVPQTQNKENKTWQSAYFHMTPTIAALTILSKFQNDIKNSEAQVVEFCHKKVGEVALIYDQFKVIANANATYLMQGEELVINAGIGAYSSAARPTVTVDGSPATALPDGSYEYKTTASDAGEHTKKVKIVYKDPQGKESTVEKDIKYTVGVPSGLVVSTDKTRAFYRGCPNELNVKGSGGDETVHVNIEGPGISFSKKSVGIYAVDCKGGTGEATVTVTDGKNQPVSFKIPIRKPPPPNVRVGNLDPANSVAANLFKGQLGVSAFMPDFIFTGLSSTIKSFTISFSGKGFEEIGSDYAQVEGPYFRNNPKAVSLISKCQSGTIVTIDDIVINMPGGVAERKEGSVSYVLE